MLIKFEVTIEMPNICPGSLPERLGQVLVVVRGVLEAVITIVLGVLAIESRDVLCVAACNYSCSGSCAAMCALPCSACD